MKPHFGLTISVRETTGRPLSPDGPINGRTLENPAIYSGRQYIIRESTSPDGLLALRQ